MATRYSTHAFSASQSPVSSYNRDGKHVAEGYDLLSAKYWFRIDFGAVREFPSRSEMETALDAEFASTPTPIRLPGLSLPQLPAYIPPVFPRDWPEVNHARQCAWVKSRSTKGHTIPSRGVICLPAPAAPAQPTRAQQHLANEFLENATHYFEALCAMDNAPLTPREKRDLKWKLDCHFQNMSHKAFTYAQLAGMGA